MQRAARFVVAVCVALCCTVVATPTQTAPAGAVVASAQSAVPTNSFPCAACTRRESRRRVVPSLQAGAVPAFSSIMSGAVVTFTLSGYQPDFDPIDRVIISAHLRSASSKSPTVPDTLVVLYLYLENFQPTTTPLLPDLLHPNQQAQNLGGFLSGKASFVDASGRELYRGGVLAEVFLDNSVHMIVDVFRPADEASGRSQRLTSTFTLYRNLSVKGTLNAKSMLSLGKASNGAAHFPSWQTIVSRLTVKKPAQYGLTDKRLLPPTPGLTGSGPLRGAPTALAGAASGPASTTSRQAADDAPPAALIIGGALIVVVAGLVAFLLLRRSREPAHV